jgi:hypothetical protein
MRPGIWVAGLLVAALALPPTAAAADFPSVVTQILMSQTTGAMSRMSETKKRLMITCVIKSLQGVPNPKKRYVTEGANLDEQEHRFGEVVMADRAKWKQQIAHDCSSIAVQGGI